MATKLVVEPIFETDFQEASFGFRPMRSAKQALTVSERRTTAKEIGWLTSTSKRTSIPSIKRS
ncbi:hypothetical protein [Paenibacillus anseongense]|uniref:hypothetical protein n=1 Tax=Paenibacillus anseongense TaxID=2682845 RepID=UPI001FE8DE93|nr:hypothetical protein [Paenibacillus anseongense]